MEAKNIFWSVNIKFLRNRLKLSQENMAEKLGITRVKLNSLESGRTATPLLEDLVMASKCFRISIDNLVMVNLSMLEESELKALEANNGEFLRGANLRVLTITVDNENRENIEYVPIKAKAGYNSGYNNPEFIASLPKFYMPNLSNNGTFRMFPTQGDSMLPIPEGSDVVVRFVQDWTNIQPGTLCILILKNDQDFVFKQATLIENYKVLLQSLNKNYEDYIIEVSDILEIWEFYSFHSRKIPEANADAFMIFQRIDMLKKEIKKIPGLTVKALETRENSKVMN